MKIRLSRNDPRKILIRALRPSSLANGGHGQVHSARLQLKRAKALLRLLRASGETNLTPLLNQLKKASDTLAPIRQKQVFRQLNSHADFPTSRDEIKKGMSAFKNAIKSLAKEKGRIIQSALSSKQIARGLRRSIKKCEKCYARCKRSHKATDFHELRKKTKDLLYQLDAIDPLLLDQTRRLKKTLKRIADLTGDAHDAIELSQQTKSPSQNKTLRKKATRLNQKSLRLAKPLFKRHARIKLNTR